ncbi:XrtA/PEP-CTERM system histidine kinase PrsK [Azospirillum canadense]|uniref:XrtA/PEP-CTERM system histidine kinase PrsK n=1 Tax=Azospirillum canadense TaxID=403962 RepID=UPI002225B891|nr:XrtA/PEP-CTERM system histidine kinase PrsK [Azospirillum canadense]MCW2240935.1 putative PEP-CTERM system histidine kinase [Azospirillum canadense]
MLPTPHRPADGTIMDFGDVIAFLVYALLMLATATGGIRGTGWLFTTAVVGGVWAAAAALMPLLGEPALWITLLADPLRMAGWTLVLLSLLWRLHDTRGRARYWHPLVLAVAVLTMAQVAIQVAGQMISTNLPAATVSSADLTIADLAVSRLAGIKVDVMIRLVLDVIGLLIVDNVFRQSGEAVRWACKHLLIGVGGILCYDLFFSAQVLMLPAVDPVLWTARPLVDGASVPLVLVSLPRLKRQGVTGRAAASPALIVHSTMLLGSGVYLMCMAVFGYLLRETGLAWGPALQVALLFGALLLLATVLASRQVRVWLRLTICRNYLPLMHDYRREWLRFIATMSASSADRDDLHERAIRAVADIFECTSGALFLRSRGDVFALVQRWNWPSAAGMVSLPEAVAARVKGECKALEVSALSGDGVPHLEAVDRPWLVVPLAVGETVLGAVLLGRPRVPRRLTWEDEELLAVLCVQLGGYIAEQQTTQALGEARRFEQVTKGVTFIAHDLKNLVSQLHLITQQADQHADDPEFRRDLIAIVRHSAEKMQRMLQRLNEQRSGTGRAAEPVDLAALVRGTIDIKRALFPTVTITGLDAGLPVAVEPLGFSAVLENLVQNAFEAAGPTVPVRIRCARAGDHALLEIRDDGPGMSDTFVRSRLATPFQSGKLGGYGIGLYQSRDLVEQAGGRLIIDSRPGAGTTIRIELPLACDASLSLSSAATTQETIHDQQLRSDERRTRSVADRR